MSMTREEEFGTLNCIQLLTRKKSSCFMPPFYF